LVRFEEEAGRWWHLQPGSEVVTFAQFDNHVLDKGSGLEISAL
jgi:hypothetical protein